jgi:ferredoxin-NADP reductase
MTAPFLLFCIIAALLVQLAGAIGFALWRRRAAVGGAPSSVRTEVSETSTLAWGGWREFRVARREYEDRANTQCSFYLEPLDHAALPLFSPGQFLTFAIQVADATSCLERTITRCYSLSDRPDPRHYRVTIKRAPSPLDRPDVPPGAVSNHFHDRIREGDVVKVKAPSGRFFIDADPMLPAVLIAGGIGITPMMSMLRWCLAEQPQHPVHLYYGVRSSDEHAFKQTLEQLVRSHPSFRLNVVYSRPGPNDWQGRDFQYAGHVDIDLLRRTLLEGCYQFYVCGPAPMMESLVPALGAWGVHQENIHYEAFGPASLPSALVLSMENRSPEAVPVAVRFRRSGRTLMWDGQDANLLDFAERHGVTVESGCRSGSCGSCETRLVSGTVRYDDKPDHEVAQGHCLLCIGRPDSPIVLEA